MKTLAPLIVLLIVLVSLSALFGFTSDPLKWSEHPIFNYTPYIIMVIGSLLGGFFMQSRILFLGILFTLITALVNYFSFLEPDLERIRVIIFLAAIFIPFYSLLFYHFRERGIFSMHGYIRSMIIVFATVIFIIVPHFLFLSDKISIEHSMFSPAGTNINIPVSGLIMFSICTPFLFIRNKNESPVLGKFLFMAVLFSFFALNFQSDLWKSGQEQTIFTTFMLATSAILTLIVIESSWRHAHMDELTDLPNRRALKHHMARLRSKYTIAMLDIDHFKRVNDKFGHHTGDEVLRFIATSIQNNLRGKTYRYGGEEFAVVFEKGNYTDIVESLDVLRKIIKAKKFGIRKKKRSTKSKPISKKNKKAMRGSKSVETISIAISIGVARHSGKHSSPQDVLKEADKALYQAKKKGRNRVQATS